jgi:ABC-type dipeptide/oligopeptide/nickel transport system permease subunit
MSQVVSEPLTGQTAGGAPEQASQSVVGRSPWQIFWLRFRRDRVALVGLAFIVFLTAVAIGAPLIAHYVAHRGPNEINSDLTDAIGLPKVGPSKEYWFGVDTVGRDVFVRTIYGARTSLTVAFVATAISVVVGTVLGTLGGFFGGKVDTAVSRAIDIVLSLPVLLLAIGIAAACSITAEGCFGGLVQPGVPLVIEIIALFSWPYIARIVRGQVLTLREKEFVEAARSQGASDAVIMFREILPNVVAPIIVYTTLIIPNNILFEASLSFLGVGIPSTTASWGRMIADAATGQLYTAAWWMLLFPGVALVLTTLAFNLVGDGLRDALDPRTGGGAE